MKRLIPNTIYGLGDYYRTPGLRELCHKVKENDVVAWEKAARALAELIPHKPFVLVPVPCVHNNGYHYTDVITLEICKFRKDLQYSFMLYTDRVVRLYDKKKRGERITEADCDFHLDSAENVIIPKDAQILLVDNVMATGVTMSAAIRAMEGRPCDALVMAVDFRAFERYKE